MGADQHLLTDEEGSSKSRRYGSPQLCSDCSGSCQHRSPKSERYVDMGFVSRTAYECAADPRFLDKGQAAKLDGQGDIIPLYRQGCARQR